MLSRMTVVTALLMTTLAGPAHAVLLAKYDLDNAPDNGTVSPQSIGNHSDAVDSTAAGVNASSITAVQTTALGFGYDDAITPNLDVNSVLSDDPGNLDNNSEDGHTWWARGTTLPNTLDTSSAPYVEFTLTADPGQVLDIDSVDLRYALHDRNVGGVYNADVALFSVNNGGVLTGLDLGTVDNNNRNYVYDTISLDASALGVTQSATLRLYFTDNSGATGKHTILDSVSIQGVVAPEPASAALLMLGVGAVAARRRRTA